MKSIIKYLIPMILAVLAFPLVGIDTAQAQGFAQGPVHAEVDRTTISTDETLLLTVNVRSSSILSAPAPSLPSLQGFDVVGSSTSSQISIVKGEITTLVSHKYRLQPYETGELVIGPVSVALGGETYTTQPITVHVTQGNGVPAPAASDNRPVATSDELTGQDLFVEAEVDNPAPYIGQQVVHTFRFYQAVNLWDQPQYQAPAFTGFWSEAQSNQQDYQAEAAGRLYRVTEIRTILFPTVVGPVTIGPARLTIPGGFFQSGQTLQTDPVELNVQPLPTGAPEGFGGAVGQFTLEAELDSSQSKVGEPLTWKVTLSGEGNLNAAPDPIWPEMDGWRSFESQATINTEVHDGQLVGSRAYERLLVPAVEGEFTVPSLEYVYFDPAIGQYHTLHTEPLPVSIAPGAAEAPMAGPQTDDSVPAASKETVEPLASDIRHLKPVPDRLGSGGESVTGSGLYWLAWVFPVLGTAGYFVWERRQRRWENNLGLARSSQARKKASTALARARRQKVDAYTAAGQILLGYLSDKLDQPLTGLTHQALADLLAERGVKPDLIERVEVLLVSGELGRFAPGADDPDHAYSLLQEVDILIRALEKVLQVRKP